MKDECNDPLGGIKTTQTRRTRDSFKSFISDLFSIYWRLSNMKKTQTVLIPATAIATIFGAAHADAAITEVANGFHTNGGSALDATAGGPYNITINAGASDFLIVGTSTELGGTTAYSVSFDGNVMDRVEDLHGNDLNQNNIFILDLSETTYTGGNATLSFTWTATAGGDLGVGWVSLDAGTLGVGESLDVVAKADSSAVAGSTVDLTTTTDTFNFVNFNHNKGANAVLSTNLTEVYRNASFGSNAGASGYEEGATAGTSTYSWGATNPRKGSAIAIGVVPEPGSLAQSI
ncbi:MAG: hypothetical protein AAF085_12775 [Planctomycetota bacterium]